MRRDRRPDTQASYRIARLGLDDSYRLNLEPPGSTVPRADAPERRPYQKRPDQRRPYLSQRSKAMHEVGRGPEMRVELQVEVEERAVGRARIGPRRVDVAW